MFKIFVIVSINRSAGVSIHTNTIDFDNLHDAIKAYDKLERESRDVCSNIVEVVKLY